MPGFVVDLQACANPEVLPLSDVELAKIEEWLSGSDAIPSEEGDELGVGVGGAWIGA